MNAETKRAINEIHESVRDIQRCLFLLDGCAETGEQVDAVEECRRGISGLQGQEIFEVLKSFEGQTFDKD